MAKPGNVYKRWLAGGRMPYPVRMPSLLRALREEMQVLEKRTDALIEKPGWTRFQAWRATEGRLLALRSLVDDTASVYRGDQVARMGAVDKAMQRLGPLRTRLGAAGLRNSAKTWLAPPRTREERLSALGKIEQWEELGTLPYPQPSQVLAQGQAARARHLAASQARGKYRIAGLDASRLERDLARRLRRNGMRADHDDLADIVCSKAPEAVRHAAWARLTAVPGTEADVTEMLRTRAREAALRGYASHAHYTLSENVVQDPDFIHDLIEGTAKSAAPALAGYYREASLLLEGTPTPRPSPWDAWRLDQKMLSRQYRRLNPHPSVFPVLPTMKVVVEDLLEVGGWHAVTPPVRHGAGAAQAWHWTLANDQGRRAHLWVTPYAATRDADPSCAAFLDSVLGRWATRRKRNDTTVFLALKRDPAQRAFAVEDLGFLAHELGHALHALALPGRIPEEWAEAPLDMGEFPSLLLERMALCPEKLAKWARPVGERYRTRAYWEGQLRPIPETLRILQDELVDALHDLEVNTLPDPSAAQVRATYARLLDISGHPALAEDDSRHLRDFCWDDYAGTKACYALDRMLIESALPAQPTPDDITTLWRAAMDHVFVLGQSKSAFREAWSAWRGESIETSLERGARRLVRRTLDQQRQAMHAVRGRQPRRRG